MKCTLYQELSQSQPVRSPLTMPAPSPSLGRPSANASAISNWSPLVIGSLAYERIDFLTTPALFLLTHPVTVKRTKHFCPIPTSSILCPLSLSCYSLPLSLPLVQIQRSIWENERADAWLPELGRWPQPCTFSTCDLAAEWCKREEMWGAVGPPDCAPVIASPGCPASWKWVLCRVRKSPQGFGFFHCKTSLHLWTP